MTAAAFRATYSDWKVIKGRKVVQIVFETPIEQADAAYKVVGGMPNPAEEKWFAIARLTEGASQAPRQAVTQTAPAGDAPKNYAQRVALLCKEPRFWRFLTERGYPAAEENDAARIVRLACRVQSRSDIIEGSSAGRIWRDMAADYDVWQRALA